MGNVCDTYFYCLLPNHFHFLIRINEPESIIIEYNKIKTGVAPVSGDLFLSDFVMERFSNFLNAYAKAFNKMYYRKGGLFLDFTKRIIIKDDNLFTKMIHYIHANPDYHRLCQRIEDWKYSSYKSFLSDEPTKLLRKERWNYLAPKITS